MHGQSASSGNFGGRCVKMANIPICLCKIISGEKRLSELFYTDSERRHFNLFL